MSSTNTKKKRRLDSEVSGVSGISGISGLSCNTHSTEVPNDSDDSQGEFTNQSSVNHSAGCPPRNRQISFNLEEDNDERCTIETNTTRPLYQHYDNRNLPQMCRRIRIRRNTDSCIQDIEHDECMLDRVNIQRSCTTNDFHPNPQQQRLITENRVRAHDAQLRNVDNRIRYAMQNRSHSVNSLRSQEHMYTSITGSGPPHDIAVTIENDSYIQPTTCIAPQITPSTPCIPNVTYRSDQGIDDYSQSSSKYARVETPVNTNTNKKCFYGSIYRIGFFILLLLNVLNIGFVCYMLMTNDGDENFCMKCVSENFDLKDFGIYVNEDGKCCLKDLDSFMNVMKEKIISTTAEKIKSPTKNTDFYKPLIQLESTDIRNQLIEWKNNIDVRTGEFSIENSYSLKIPQSGYYYIYTDIRFKLKLKNDAEIFHEIMIVDGETKTPETITSPKENTPPRDKYSSHQVIVRHLNKGDLVSVKLSHKEAENDWYDPSVIGMFLVSE